MSDSKEIKNAAFGILIQILAFTVGIIIPYLVLVILELEASGLLKRKLVI